MKKSRESRMEARDRDEENDKTHFLVASLPVDAFSSVIEPLNLNSLFQLRLNSSTVALLEACQHEEGGEGGHKRVKSGRFAAEKGDTQVTGRWRAVGGVELISSANRLPS